jgi:hypothetical protein
MARPRSIKKVQAEIAKDPPAYWNKTALELEQLAVVHETQAKSLREAAERLKHA